MARNMFDVVTLEEKSQRQETFAESVSRQNLSIADLLNAYRRQRLIAFLLLGLIVIALFYVASLLMSAQHFSDVIVGIAAIAPISVLAVAAFRGSFRAWQIRNKRLGGLKEFLANRREWWPVRISESTFADLSLPAPVKPKKTSKGGAGSTGKTASGKGRTQTQKPA